MANKLHKDLTGDELHFPKGFAEASNATGLIKNEDGDLEYRDLSILGEVGPQGPIGPDSAAIDNVVIVNKVPGPNQFSDPIAAMASITDSSTTNPYVLKIGPGIYSLSAPLVLKEGVTVKSDGHSTVILEPATVTNDIVQIPVSNCRIQGMTLRNATGASAAAVRISSAASLAILDFMTIQNCTESIVLQSSTQDVQTVLRNVRLISGATTTKLLRISAAGGFKAIARIYSAIITDDNGTVFEDAIYLEGSGARLDGNTLLVRSTLEVGNGIRLRDGAELVSQSGAEVEGFDKNLFVENVGAACIVRTTTIMLRNGATFDLDVQQSTAMGSIIAKADVEDKVFIHDDAPLKVVMLDPLASSNIGVFLRGDVVQAEKFSQPVNISKLGRASATMGRFEGGELSDGGGLDIDVTAGSGFLVDPSELFVKEVEWSSTIITVPANSSRYIYVNTNGVVSQSASLPDLAQNIVLGRVSALPAGIHFIQKISLDVHQFSNRASEFHREAFGPIYSTGSIVSENGSTDRALDISSGSYWFSTQNFMPSGGVEVEFSQFYRQAGIFNVTPGLTVVNNTHYDDGSGTLASLGAGKYAKHSLYTTGDGVDEQYFLVISQAQYDTLVEAEAANIPMPPQSFDDAVPLIASIVVQQGQTNLISILDNRSVLGFKAQGVSASADHGNLLGLLDDDHPQYLLVTGSRAMSGDLNMGGNAITSVGLVDGVDVSAHASRHNPGGSDALSTATAVEITDSTNSEGNATSFARSNHGHSHGSRGGGSLHAVATTSVAGFMSAADKVKVDALPALFGTQHQSKTVTTPGSTNSTTLVNFDTFSVTSIPAGTYKISWYIRHNRSGGTGRSRFRIQLDGSDLVPLLEQGVTNAAEVLSSSGFRITTFGSTSTHSITLDFATTAAGVATQIQEYVVEIFRIS